MRIEDDSREAEHHALGKAGTITTYPGAVQLAQHRFAHRGESMSTHQRTTAFVIFSQSGLRRDTPTGWMLSTHTTKTFLLDVRT